MSETTRVRLEQDGEVTVLLIDNPPVNALSPEVVRQLGEAVHRIEQDRSTKAVIVACAGRTFVAGGDIAAFDDPAFSAAPFNAVLARLERLDRPVIASMHGFAFGGGLELALACHWRLAVGAAQFALPEVKLGLLPGSLGTQRLPRLVGVELALDLIASGRTLDAGAALVCGLVDAHAEGDAVKQGVAYARQLLQKRQGVRRTSALAVDARRVPADFFVRAREEARAKRSAYPSALAIVDAVEASLLPFEKGEQVEARAFEALRATRESRALRHLFFAPRQATKVPGVPAGTVARPVQSVGVLGGGTMGRGIAINFLNADLPVQLLETTEEAAENAVRGVREVYEAAVAKGKLPADQLPRRMQLLRAGTDDSALAGCDLVIEAVYEDLQLKLSVCERLGRVCRPGAIIATNTSTLDVDALARATGRAADVLGLHFFSPAHIMRLLEVVRGAETAPDVLATVLRLAGTIGKVPVVAGVCWGFIGNRMLEVYLREAEFLLMEGATPKQLDDAMEGLGLAMGPCRMLDMAGIDVGAKVVLEQAKGGRLPDDASYRAVVRRLHELGRNGQKAGRGYYRYEGRKALPDPEVDQIARELADRHGIARRTKIESSEIAERLLFPLINEGARILEEGIAYRGSDIDVVWTSGYGFPDHRGGPMFHADMVGLPHIVARLAHYAIARGNTHGYWTASRLLTQLAAQGGQLHTWNSAP